MNQKKSSGIGAFLDEYAEPLQFMGTAAVVFALLQFLYYSFYVGSDAFFGYLRVCAVLSTELLQLIGEDVFATGRTITSQNGPSVTVVEGCDALRIFSVLIAAMVAFEATTKQKIRGIAISIAVMYCLNLVRISSLLWFDVHYTEFFDFAHHVLLPLALWFAAMLLFYHWGQSVTSVPITDDTA